MKKEIKLYNSLFIFESSDDLQYFWNEILMENTKREMIIGNTFMVIKDNWILRFIKWIFRV